MQLNEWIINLLASGVLGVIGSALTAELRMKWPWLDHARDFVRFVAAGLIACAMVALALVVLMWLGAMPWPATAQVWAETAFQPCLIAVTASQAWFQARKP